MFNTEESFSSEGEKEDTCTSTCHPDLKACGKESSISYGVKRQQSVFPGEKRSEESGGHDLYGQSSSAREGRQRHMLMDSDEKPKISCLRGKAPANVIVHQCNNTGEKPFSCSVHEATPSPKKNMKSHQRTHAGDECHAKDQSLDVKQSTSLTTEAEDTKRSTLCQTVCRNSFKYFFQLFHNGAHTITTHFLLRVI